MRAHATSRGSAVIGCDTDSFYIRLVLSHTTSPRKGRKKGEMVCLLLAINGCEPGLQKWNRLLAGDCVLILETHL